MPHRPGPHAAGEPAPGYSKTTFEGLKTNNSKLDPEDESHEGFSWAASYRTSTSKHANTRTQNLLLMKLPRAHSKKGTNVTFRSSDTKELFIFNFGR